MPRFTVRTGDAPLPRKYREGFATRVLPVAAVTPGTAVLVNCPGVINGFTQVRSIKRHGDALAVATDYGTAHAAVGQTVRVLDGAA